MSANVAWNKRYAARFEGDYAVADLSDKRDAVEADVPRVSVVLPVLNGALAVLNAPGYATSRLASRVRDRLYGRAFW